MEFVEDSYPIENIHTSVKPKTYSVNIGKKQIYLLPINNLIDYDVKSLIKQLRGAIGSRFFDREILSNTEKLQKKITLISSRKLREFFHSFITNKKLDPINVIKVMEISDPTHVNVNKTYRTVDQYGNPLKYIDDIYRPVGGDEIIALSIYFRCNYVPVVIMI